LKHVDIFTGIGGWPLGFQRAFGDAYEPVAFCEKDAFCRKVLKKHWPDVSIVEDVFEMKGSDYGSVDIVSCSPPCQPYSVAGKRGGSGDDRALWPQVIRVIREMQLPPMWICFENVPGLLSIESGLALDQVLADLEAEGYEVGTLVLPACGVGAWHIRQRVWIVAHSDSQRCDRKRVCLPGQSRQDYVETARSSAAMAHAGSNGRDADNGRQPVCDRDGDGAAHATGWPEQQSGTGGDVFDTQDVNGAWPIGSRNSSRRSEGEIGNAGDVEDAERDRLQESGNSRVSERAADSVADASGGQVERGLRGVVNGFSCGLHGSRVDYWETCPMPEPTITENVHDRVNRLKALGNAVVPQIVEELGRVILSTY
jgi:DNA (cytosine-5)-methyltransferase 1